MRASLARAGALLLAVACAGCSWHRAGEANVVAATPAGHPMPSEGLGIAEARAWCGVSQLSSRPARCVRSHQITTITSSGSPIFGYANSRRSRNHTSSAPPPPSPPPCPREPEWLWPPPEKVWPPPGRAQASTLHNRHVASAARPTAHGFMVLKCPA